MLSYECLSSKPCSNVEDIRRRGASRVVLVCFFSNEQGGGNRGHEFLSCNNGDAPVGPFHSRVGRKKIHE